MSYKKMKFLQGLKFCCYFKQAEEKTEWYMKKKYFGYSYILILLTLDQ